MEQIRDIRVKVVLNTNKRTVVLDEEVDSLDEAVEKVEQFQERWSDL